MKKLILFGLLVVVLSSCYPIVQVRESVYVTVEPMATDPVPTVNATETYVAWREERRLDEMQATAKAHAQRIAANAIIRAVEATERAEERDRTVFDSFGSASFEARMMNLRGYEFIWDESVSGYWYDSQYGYGLGIYPEGGNKNRDVQILMARFMLENGLYRDYQADAFEEFLADLGFPSSLGDDLWQWMIRSDSRHIYYEGDDMWRLFETVGGYSIASVHTGVDAQNHFIDWMIIISER